MNKGADYSPIEDYGLIGDCRSAALVSRNGSLDWLCWPRFDSPACFAALIGDAENGQWSIAPVEAEGFRVSRAYRGNTMVLETVFEGDQYCFAIIDFMPIECPSSSLVRVVEGRKGKSQVKMDLRIRFDYGAAVPWVTRSAKNTLQAVAGPNLVVLRGPVTMKGEHYSTIADFTVAAGDKIPFVLSYGPSHLDPPGPVDAFKALDATEKYWEDWSACCSYEGPNRHAVLRSLLTLKALTYQETGGIVAAPTTSLPEQICGPRNWDYRYCWIRDATLTLTALMGGGYYAEATAWRDWLHRAVAGKPEDLQILYGVAGERQIWEWEASWLSGYRRSAPVRIGNAASSQLQLDVWGEMADALYLARAGGIQPQEAAWDVQTSAVEHLRTIWRHPDEGIWEVRGGPRHFTYSKIMAWVAFDRSIKDADAYGLPAPIAQWRHTRDEIHRTVCSEGYNDTKKAFTQSFGDCELDASLLLIPQLGFLSIDDPRVTSTVAAIERELMSDGFVLRYRTESGTDGLPSGEGVFLPCSFWLVDVYQRQGRLGEAEHLLQRLLSLRNDLGLLSEEYDTKERCQVGNFPQAFSHLALVQAVIGLHRKRPLRDQVRDKKNHGSRRQAAHSPAPQDAS